MIAIKFGVTAIVLAANITISGATAGHASKDKTRIDSWLFGKGRALREYRKPHAVMLVFGTIERSQLVSIDSIQIPKKSVPPTGFRELFEQYQHDLGSDPKLVVEFVSRGTAFERARFHVDTIGPHNVTHRITTELWRSQWLLLEINYGAPENSSIAKMIKQLVDSISLVGSKT